MTRLVIVTTVPQTLYFFRGQVGFMSVRGVEVEAISSPGPKLIDFGRDESILTHEVDLPRQITPLRDLKAMWELAGIFRRRRPEIVHSNTPKGGLLGMISSWLTRVPVRIYHIHGLPYMAATGRRRTLLKLTEWISCRLAHRVYCVSHSIRQVAIEDGLVPEAKVIVFHGGSVNGIDSTERFNPNRFSPETIHAQQADLGISEGDLVIGFIGRIVRDKGIHELAAAWRQIRSSHRSLRLVLVGPIEPQDPVSPDILAQLQQDDRVTMIDWVDDTSVMYPLFDLLVLPTYREGFPNVPLEAAAMELPVVATRIPGCIDAVEDGVTGTLVPARDAEALAAAIMIYVDDPELRKRHGRAGRERVVRDFKQEVIWEAMYQEYCRLLREKGMPVPIPLENPE